MFNYEKFDCINWAVVLTKRLWWSEEYDGVKGRRVFFTLPAMDSQKGNGTCFDTDVIYVGLMFPTLFHSALKRMTFK